MDYKYIEQLLDRYFDCMTTLEEEQILRSFFNQEDVPAHLMQYRDIFVFQTEAHAEELGTDFDARMLKMVSEEKRETRIFHLRRHVSPLFRAAAIVAVLISVSNIVEHSMSNTGIEQPSTSTAISPYIRTVDIESAVQIKDVSRAKANTVLDSIPTLQGDDNVESVQ